MICFSVGVFCGVVFVAVVVVFPAFFSLSLFFSPPSLVVFFVLLPRVLGGNRHVPSLSP